MTEQGYQLTLGRCDEPLAGWTVRLQEGWHVSSGDTSWRWVADRAGRRTRRGRWHPKLIDAARAAFRMGAERVTFQSGASRETPRGRPVTAGERYVPIRVEAERSSHPAALWVFNAACTACDWTGPHRTGGRAWAEMEAREHALQCEHVADLQTVRLEPDPC
ncbi:MAG: hypothetical protein F4011_11410 [Acidimicrobiaceae bacterium]|nr:hypothetical protein [Acidobacteriota bacterium]MYL04772.1 hypothetical protein [Acidimicrobiaceae bacterium]